MTQRTAARWDAVQAVGWTEEEVQGYNLLLGIAIGIASVAAGALIGTAQSTDAYLQQMRQIYDKYN